MKTSIALCLFALCGCASSQLEAMRTPASALPPAQASYYQFVQWLGPVVGATFGTKGWTGFDFDRAHTKNDPVTGNPWSGRYSSQQFDKHNGTAQLEIHYEMVEQTSGGKVWPSGFVDSYQLRWATSLVSPNQVSGRFLLSPDFRAPCYRLDHYADDCENPSGYDTRANSPTVGTDGIAHPATLDVNEIGSSENIARFEASSSTEAKITFHGVGVLIDSDSCENSDLTVHFLKRSAKSAFGPVTTLQVSVSDFKPGMSCAAKALSFDTTLNMYQP